jgi:hypothetical protein
MRQAVSAALVALIGTVVLPVPASAQFLTVQQLRAAFGFDYATLKYDSASDDRHFGYDESQRTPIVTVQGAIALLDPGILQVDWYGDFRFLRLTRKSDAVDIRSRDRFGDLRLGMNVLSARGAPVRLFYDRLDTSLRQRQTSPLTSTIAEPSLFGVQTTKGFTWLYAGGRLPQISLSGTTTNREDRGEFTAGGLSRYRERLFDGRATGSRNTFRYELSANHRGVQQRYPLADLESDYGTDMLRATASATPVRGLTVSAGTHYSRYTFSQATAEGAARSFDGTGADAGVDWRWSRHWGLTGSYVFSSNAVEFALEGAAPAVGPTAPLDQLPELFRGRILYQDAAASLTFRARRGATTATVGPRVLVLDPPRTGVAVLDELHTMMARVDHGWRWLGLDLGLGGSAAAGAALSNFGDRGDYRDAGATARATRRVRAARIGADVALQDTDGPWFYPISGTSWRAGVDVDAGAPSWAKLRGSAAQSRLRRDTYIQNGDDRSRNFSAGLNGPRYDLSVDHARLRSSATGLLDTTLLAVVRPDILAQTRRDLYGVLYGTAQEVSTVTLRLSVLPALEVNGRALRDRREYPGVYHLDQRGVTIAATWSIRASQLEIGFDRLDLRSSHGRDRNRRFYVRIRRDVPFI